MKIVFVIGEACLGAGIGLCVALFLDMDRVLKANSWSAKGLTTFDTTLLACILAGLVGGFFWFIT